MILTLRYLFTSVLIAVYVAPVPSVAVQPDTLAVVGVATLEEVHLYHCVE